MANAFEPKSKIPLNSKASPLELEPARPMVLPNGLTLPDPKPKRKQCSLYLSVDMMDQVKRIARRQGVTIGAVIEACVKMALSQIDES